MMESKRKSQHTEAAVERTQKMLRGLECPIPLNREEKKFFTQIIHSRAIQSWSDYDRHAAGLLARNLRRVEELSKRLDDEGYTITGSRGNDVANPIVYVLKDTTLTVRMLTTLLGLSANNMGLTNNAAKKRNLADRAARAVLEKAAQEDEEDLI